VLIGAIGGDDRGTALVALAEDLEERIGAEFFDRQIAQFVDDEDARFEVLGHFALDRAIDLRGGQRVDDVDRGGEQRQAGHALIEPPCRDKERLLLGFDTPSKSVILGSFLIPLWGLYTAETVSWTNATALLLTVAQHWFILTALVVFGRVFVLIGKHGLRNALVWFVKLITDPFTDVIAYYPSLHGKAV